MAIAALLALVVSGASVTFQPTGAPPRALTDALPVLVGSCGTGGSADPVVVPASDSLSAASALPDMQVIVRPEDTRTRTVAHGGATLRITPGAVRLPVGVGITALSASELPALDPEMTNVTARPRGGYRFTPHPMTFAEDITVSLPYDPALLTEDFTPQDIYTYFYDDVAGCWQPLERLEVDETNHLVISATDHFTNMINATVMVPEHPEGESFDPNQLKDIQAADPGSGINLIAPPGVNSQGENRLTYPIEVPPGRQGLTPQLQVGYTSSGGNGWLGVGWDLPMQSIVVDTRWGVPRYSDTQETETYLFNGEQLTPVAHRGPPQPRSADKVFHIRVEGGFARIVRRGSSPSTYTWEVTEKDGTTYFYGGDPDTAGPAADSTLADSAGHVFQWALRTVRDANGNTMRYHCVVVADSGVDGGTEPGRNLYVERITYTGQGGSEGRYAVTFVRDRELGEPLRVDKSIDARGGFKRVTADLLRRVDVTLDGELIRRYEFDYTTGAFTKTLLRSISQFDGDGALFNAHRFDYFDDIRDEQGQYQAFEQVPWTSPSDGLGNDALNLTPAEAGEASALNANASTGAGGHLYVGVGTAPTKSGSVGVKAGFNHTENEGLLALVDVDGDTLPDKVFQSGDSVRYRRNLSRPGGQPRFDDTARSLALPAILSEDSNSVTVGIESYVGGVAAQLDHVNTFATTSQYFSDVNGDGLSDLVNGGNVLFGRVGPDGTPVYGISQDTPVPISAGPVDTSGLFGDLEQERERQIDSFPLLDSVRRWVAPFDGQVRIEGGVRLSPETAAARSASRVADGVRVSIQHEDTQLWTATIGPRDDTEHAPDGVDSVSVSRGDRLYFRVGSVFDGSLDEVSWDPRVTYLGVPEDTVDVNNLPVHRYQAAPDFTLGGRSAEVGVPLTGTMHLSGDLTKHGTTSDAVTVIITRDGDTVFTQTLAGTAFGAIPVNLDLDVVKGQTLAWRVRVDSPIDVAQLEWVPRAVYTAAEGVDRLTDADGNPLIAVDPPYELDLYPVNDLSAPQDSFAVATDSTLTVDPALAFDFGGQQPTARVAFTVKRHGQLLAKRFFDITDGALSSPAPFAVAANAGDELFFDFATTDTSLRDFLTFQSVQVSTGGGAPVSVPSALHSSAEQGAFPQPYRGWAAVGYNGNRDRAAAPIAQNDLVIDENFADQLPGSVDPPGQSDDFLANPRVAPPTVVPFAPSPRLRQWGSGEHVWVNQSGASSSRLGVESLTLPTPQDFASGTAVPRLSRSDQISLTGSIGGPIGSIGGSIATGESTGQVDYLDMNGDNFPDVVGSQRIQYTDPSGALGSTTGVTPDGAVRRSSNVSGNASAGSAARTIATGRGYAKPPATGSATTAQSGNDMPPLGVGANLGTSTSDSKFDLLDMNGDGLPDRVYEDGRVALNLGYRFGAAEQWRNPAPLNDGGGSNSGLNLGFNTDFYGFAGGASFSQGSTSTASTLQDMNGDGLLDRVLSGSPIRVGLNTGNGFEPPVPFNGSLSDINGDSNAQLGGGAYFTFGICFLVVCVVINPGADVSTGSSRTEQALRDINGDGYTDHLASTQDSQLTVAQNRTGRTNLLRSVTRPLGARMDFEYARDGNTFDQPQSRWVLAHVSVHDGQPGDGQDVQQVSFEYQNGVFDRLEREFYGYGTVTERHRDAGADGAVFRSVVREFHTDSHYTRGLLRRELTVDSEGRPFEETRNTYELRDVANPDGQPDPASTTATLFPQRVRTDRLFYEGQPTATKATFSLLEYDQFGNTTRTFDAGEPGAADDVDTRVGYTAEDPACQQAHIVGTPDNIDVSGNGTLMRHRESTVDCTTGDIQQVRAMLADGTAAVTDLDYFPNGNLRTVISPPNEDGQRYRLDYTYDTVVDTHVESIVDSFGLRSTTTHDLRFGLVETTTDFNGQVVRNSYDSVGRLDTVIGPYEIAEDRVTIDFEYHPEADVPFAVTRHIDRQADGSVRPDTIDTITFVDGLGRNTQTKKDATIHTGPDSGPVDAMVVSGRVRYDFLGQAVEQFYPVVEPKGAGNTVFNPALDTVDPTRISYDVIGRVTRTQLPDNTVSTSSYGFGPDRAGVVQFETVSTDANGKSKRTYEDLRQLTTSVKEFNPAGGQPVIWTSYGYDSLGQLTTVTDDRGNQTTADYDDFGRRTVFTSPDAGRVETRYDLAGNITASITAKLAATAQAIRYEYDFNRVSAISYPVFTANNVTYTYGEPGAPHNAAGRVTSMTDGAGTVSREYGPLGEIVRETRTSPAQGSHIHTFTTEYRFDTWNRMLGMTFPDGEVLSYHYNSGGQVDAATGVKGEFTYQYLRRLDYDKFEQRVLLDTGNGTRTQYTYDAADRRLRTLQARISQGYVFQNLNYEYDNVGNVTSIHNDTLPPDTPNVGKQVGGPTEESFQYDDLYRLVHAEGAYNPRTPRENRYSVELSYDTIGNITDKNQSHVMLSNGNAIVQGKTSYDYVYTYAGAQPHAPNTLGPFTIRYDANGNQISREQQPRPRRQMIWDEENRLACSHENVQSQTLPQTPASCDNAGGTPNNARYFYDDKGNRVVKDGAQFHIYPNQNFSTRGNQEFKHVYVGPTKLVTKFVEPAHRMEDRQFYAHSDQLGSAAFVTDDQGELSEHLQYFPGGETWVSEHASQPVPQQYTGKELDPETNLYYYGARYYDPRTQLWQTPDPALGSYLDGAPNAGVFHSGNLSLYTYAQNNPVRLNDPTGEWVNIAIGAGIGLLVGVGVEGVRQAVTGDFNAGRLAGAAGAGVISGAVAGATMGASLAVQGTAAVGAGVTGGVVSRAIAGEEQTAGAIATDAVVSGVTFGVVKGGSALLRSARGSAPAPQVAPAPGAAPSATGVAAQRARELQAALPAGSKGRVTMAVGVGTDKSGATRVVVGTSEPRGYLRKGVELLPGEELARGTGHAEKNVLGYMTENSIKPVAVGAGRPICDGCATAIREAGAAPATPLKNPGVILSGQ